jgi:hypothetical protein
MRGTLALVALCACNQILGVGDPHLNGGGGGGDDGGGITDGARSSDGGVADAPMVVSMSGPRHRTITIPSGKVSASLAAFPMWIDIVDPDLAMWADASGSDIYFESSSGSVLPLEIEHWIPAQNRLTGWVSTSVAAAGSTLQLCYGDGSNHATNASQVWPGYQFVFHFDNLPVGNSSTLATDSVGQQKANLVGVTVVSDPDESSQGLQFIGGTGESAFEMPNIPNAINVTVSFILDHPATYAGAPELVASWGTNSQNDLAFEVDSATMGAFETQSGMVVDEPFDGLHVFHINAQTNNYAAYYDGTQVATGGLVDEIMGLQLGYNPNIPRGTLAGNFVETTGIVDEARITNAIESTAQIAADAATLKPGFYSVGSVQLGACN